MTGGEGIRQFIAENKGTPVDLFKGFFNGIANAYCAACHNALQLAQGSGAVYHDVPCKHFLPQRELAAYGHGHIPVAATYLGQIAPTVEFYDFDAKYTDSSTQLYIPAHIDAEQAEKIRAEAVRAYKVMDCEGLSRVDFFALENGEFVLNEINNLPGFTSISMYPKLFEAAGVSYSELIDRLIETARIK